jgi:hypothetical protein
VAEGAGAAFAINIALIKVALADDERREAAV